jgi:hypothetical protein
MLGVGGMGGLGGGASAPQSIFYSSVKEKTGNLGRGMQRFESCRSSSGSIAKGGTYSCAPTGGMQPPPAFPKSPLCSVVKKSKT